MGDHIKPFFAKHSLMLLLCASIFSSYSAFGHSTRLLNDGDALYPLLFADSIVSGKTRFMWYLPQATFAIPDLSFSVVIALLGIDGIYHFLAFSILYYLILIL